MVITMDYLKLILSKEDWLRIEFSVDGMNKKNIENFKTEEYRAKWEKINPEIDEFIEFMKELKASDMPKRDLITYDKSKHVRRVILLNLNKGKNNFYILTNLFKNNDKIFYSYEVDEFQTRNSDFSLRNLSIEEQYYLDMLKHLVKLVEPFEFQETMEYLAEKYAEEGAKIDEIQYEFHKSLRQVDPLGNPHVEMILWNMLNLTDLPHRVFRRLATPLEVY